MKKVFLVLIFTVFLCGNAFARISVEYFGGAGRVSGSCALLKTDDKNIIVDCGSFYEENNLPADNSTVDKKLVNADAMVLTHAHNDHCGKIPVLINEGFSGNIYCTQATKKIFFEVYDDGWSSQEVKHNYFWSKNKKAKIETVHKGILTLHWYNECKKNMKDVEYCREQVSMTELKKEHKINMKFCKKCLKKDIELMEGQFVCVDYKEKINLSDKINFMLYDAGHISGSASVFFNIYDDNETTKVVFSGDLGSGLSKITPDKDIVPKADFIFIETTYGAGTKNVSYADYDNFQNTIAQALNNDKIVWIPSLSLHRTQKILYEINRAQQKGIIDENVPVYSLSPSSNGITKCYQTEIKNPSQTKWFKDEVYSAGSILPKNYITKKPKNFDAPCIIISASGMMDQGVSAGLLKKLLPLDNTEVFLVSYASPQTPAGRLKKSAKYIKTKQGSVKVGAKVNIFDIFSDHADSAELLRWLSEQDYNTHLYLVHGEKETLNRAQKIYKNKGFKNTEIAVVGTHILK